MIVNVVCNVVQVWAGALVPLVRACVQVDGGFFAPKKLVRVQLYICV